VNKEPVDDNSTWAIYLLSLILIFPVYYWIEELSPIVKAMGFLVGVILLVGFVLLWFSFCSIAAIERKKKKQTYQGIPESLKIQNVGSIVLGIDAELTVPVFLPEKIRSRHVHILGATGSGKTESVVLNFLRQDIKFGRGAIILDAKGDESFQKNLKAWLPPERLCVLDLANASSMGFDPIQHGSPMEAAQRLHASLTWSEDYYKAKAFTALLRLFETHFKKYDRNPNLKELNSSLYNAATFVSAIAADSHEKKTLLDSYSELAGLCDQVKALTLGNTLKLLSPTSDMPQIHLADVLEGKVIYFRLQSLISPQTVGSVGKLIINNINFLAGTAHRGATEGAKARGLIPIFLDEFAAFACPEFAELISMARSAKFALHFSHQSIGDLMNVDKGFVSQLTDNSGTKIIMRVNDPDTAEYFAKTFGTRLIEKVTQRITRTDNIENAELVGEGSSREAHQFRANPDLLKTLPTGMAACLIAHGEETIEGGSHVFKIKFPRLEEVEK